MRIPLDYYRILGVPIQASNEQLQQAYRDRLLQLPRREYSEKVIAARKQLIDAAYKVLAHPQQRQRYDSNYFVAAYGERSLDTLTEAPPSTTEVAPSIEITDEQFTGALLILQELGEYELVLNLGQPYLNLENEPNNNDPDLVLTIALACLELGREQWQQVQYEKAAYSLEHGYKLLENAGLFAKTSQEIVADLDKLRPYRILELLSLPLNHVAERKQGLQLLQDILQQRGGIDGTGDDGSGLALDDFLRFIQQLRNYLTVREQQELFEAESQRPSPVANYLAVYALIGRGFAEGMPILIRKAKLHLMRLGKRQDVHLEQAVCSLLLGQTTEASRAVELSQEAEALALIEENSLGSPDLLPGLCLYSEKWLHEVFAQFRDLGDRAVSLKDYFADEQVQSYLEALPTEIEATNEWDAVKVDESPRQVATANTVKSAASQGNTEHYQAGAIALATRSEPDESQIVHIKPRQRAKKRRGRFSGGIQNPKIVRLALFALVGLGGIILLGFVASKTYSWVQSRTAAPALRGEQPLVTLNEPLFDLAEIEPPSPDSLLTETTARQVIEEWLSTKAVAFGSTHASTQLEQILVNPTLSQWQQRVAADKARNRYREYKHALKIDAVETEPANRNRAIVTATVNEIAQVYGNGELSKSLSYDENLQVKYDLVRQSDGWRIREMVVLK